MSRNSALRLTSINPSSSSVAPAPSPRSARRHLEGRALRFGPSALDDNETLRLVCGVEEPAAEALLTAFGSIPEVFGAPAADLVRVAGVSAAVRLKLAQDVARRALAQPLRRRDVFTAWSQVAAYLRTVMVGLPREQFRALFLDKKNQLIAEEVMNEGTVDHAPVYPREIMRRALELSASAVILAHNHPSGDPTPSSADIDMTRQVVEAARALRIAVHDHVLVAGDQAVSFRALGVM